MCRVSGECAVLLDGDGWVLDTRSWMGSTGIAICVRRCGLRGPRARCWGRVSGVCRGQSASGVDGGGPGELWRMCWVRGRWGVGPGSLRREEGGPGRFLTSLGEAWVHGVEVDWGVS